MTDKEIIRMLIKQNDKLMMIIDDFAKKSIIVNSTVNSYNNPNAKADVNQSNENKPTTKVDQKRNAPIVKIDQGDTNFTDKSNSETSETIKRMFDQCED